MFISAFTFCHNTLTLGYPFLESIKSVIPIVDEVIVVVPKSEDGTLESIKGLNEPCLKIIEAEIIDFNSKNYYAYYTDFAFKSCSGDWCIYIQADEVIPEKSYPIIRAAMEKFQNRKEIEGMALKFRHFYGSPKYYHEGSPWYSREVRILRRDGETLAWGDAQGFRKRGRKLRVALLPAYIHHYGWMLPPEKIVQKVYISEIVRGLRRKGREDIPLSVPKPQEIFHDTYALKRYTEEHPKCMDKFISSFQWDYNPVIRPARLKRRIQKMIADVGEFLFNRRFFEYQNFVVVERFKKCECSDYMKTPAFIKIL